VVSAPNLQSLELSPDARRVAVDEQTDRPSSDIWIHDLDRGTGVRLTFDPGDESGPVWSADGERIYFASRRGTDPYRILEKAASGAGEERVVLGQEDDCWPWDATSDGRFLIVGEGDYSNRTPRPPRALPLAGGDLLPLPLDPGSLITFVQASPDGRFLAYTSDASGADQVYVAAFRPPSPGEEAAARSLTAGKWQISTAGGSQPRWRGDGREIYYLRPDNTVMAVRLAERDGALEILGETPLFRALQRGDAAAYDVTPDGEHFLLNTLGTSGTRPLVLVVGWSSAIRRGDPGS
jgi:Tol biopolymer transport system component